MFVKEGKPETNSMQFNWRSAERSFGENFDEFSSNQSVAKQKEISQQIDAAVPSIKLTRCCVFLNL